MECLVERVLNNNSAMRHRSTGGFTLVDVLVAIAVIGLLIGLLIPALSTVHETSRRVICASNLRQLGLGLQMYADDYRGQVPPSAFLADGASEQTEMMTIRLAPDHRVRMTRNGWDGLGILYRTNYLKTPRIFYCPSHWGEHPFERYANEWRQVAGEIVGNYHFRGEDGDGLTNLYNMLPNSALAADGMRTQDDYNHKSGLNVLRVGGHVAWLNDSDGQLAALLADDDGNADGTPMEEAWDLLDYQ